MRNSFINTLTQIAAQDSRIVLLTGDLGFHVIEPFAKQFPDRFYNMGVAEQNMAGVATGLAEAGYLPFIYSIGPFATLRPFEFLRNGPIHQHLPVRIVAVGAGYAYGELGPSHHLLEDIAVFRPFTNLSIISPIDAAQTCEAVKTTYDLPQPIYYRLGKNENQHCEALAGQFDINTLTSLRKGSSAVAFCLGDSAFRMLTIADMLSHDNLDLEVHALTTINPIPREQIISVLQKQSHCISYEPHYLNGGIGSILAEIIAEEGLNCKLLRCGSRASNDGVFGSEDFMYNKQGLDPDTIYSIVKPFIQKETA